jgi:hypothetical protein
VSDIQVNVGPPAAVEVVIQPLDVAATVTGGVGPQGPQGPAGPAGLSTVAISGGTVPPPLPDIPQQVAA